MAISEQAFAHALCQKACLQVMYAQAERRSASNKAPSPSKSVRQPRPPLPASAVHVVERVTDALADVVIAFIQQVARSSARRSQLCGRNSTNLLDVLSALNAISSATQATVRDIARYATHQRIDFPTDLPTFPILPSTLPSKRARDRVLDIPSEDAQATRQRTYIEPWMPPIPNAHTFVSNPGVLAPSNRTAHAWGPEQRRRVELSLERLRDAGSHTADPASQLDSVPTPSLAATAPTANPFTALPKVAMSGSMASYPSAPRVVEPVREPFEDEELQVDTNTDVVQVTKFNISDQKRARVERILNDSGTIMLGSTAQADVSAAATPSTPNDNTAPSPKAGA